MAKAPTGAGRTRKHAASRKHAAARQHKHQAHSKHHPGHQQTPPPVVTPVLGTIQHVATPKKKRTLAAGYKLPCIAAALQAASGYALTDAEVLAVCPDVPGGMFIEAVLETARRRGYLAAYGQADPGRGLILGVSLPAPHAVAVAGDTWLTWGEPWPLAEFPGAAIEESWWVRWN